MSTSPDKPEFERIKRPARPDSPKISGSGTLSPVRGLLWASGIVALLIMLVWNADAVWDLIAEFVPLGLEVIEEALDTLFEAVGLTPPIAQMATAYTGVVLGLGVLYLLVRKSIVWSRNIKATVSGYKRLYVDLGKAWWVGLRQRALNWWAGLDWMNRIAVIVFLVLIGIPLAFLLSYVLGSAVTMLF